jgi:hypothetical protein
MNPVESNKVCLEAKTKYVPPTGCCKDILKEIKHQQTVNNNTLSVNTTLSAGPVKMKKVSVSLVDFQVIHAKDCDMCEKDPKNMGNIVNPTSPVTWTYQPPTVSYSHLIEWNDKNGKDWSNGIPLQFEVPLPTRSPIACCCDTILYCIKYSFTDTACVTCDTIICYKTYNGKDCKGNDDGGGHGDVCDCSFKPTYSYEGGKKEVACNGSITLFKGNIPVSFNPNFNCVPASQNCTPSGLTVTITNVNTGVTTMLSGPNYNYTFLQSGTYIYNTSGTCGGKKCECRTTVIIPQ